MKKLLGLFLCMLMFVGITACDDTEQKVKLDSGSLMTLGAMLTSGEDNIAFLYNLSGTTWVNTRYVDVIVKTEEANPGAINETTTITEIPLTIRTSTMTFNPDGSFAATIREVFTENMDEQHRTTGNIAYDHESYTVNGVTNGAYSGYGGSPTEGCSIVDVVGEWRVTEDYFYNGGEADPVFIKTYQIRIVSYTFNKVTDLTEDASAPDDNVTLTKWGSPNDNYGVSARDIGTVNLNEEDADWQTLDIDFAGNNEPSGINVGMNFDLPTNLTTLPRSNDTSVITGGITFSDNVIWRLQ